MKLDQSARAQHSTAFDIVTRGSEDECHLSHRKLMYLIQAIDTESEDEEVACPVDVVDSIRGHLENETTTRAFEKRMQCPGLYPDTYDDREIPMYDLDDYLDIVEAVVMR
eukprot:GHVH01008301.1.p1 GENE.GHVH01008301.1~~GHVH01008301.1.p1  ORF type:complete len:110 (+),score=19.15 GHVH01008301.1:96-425(+)